MNIDVQESMYMNRNVQECMYMNRNVQECMCRNACMNSYSLIPRLRGEEPAWDKARLAAYHI